MMGATATTGANGATGPTGATGALPGSQLKLSVNYTLL